jgi:hypothetical protein
VSLLLQAFPNWHFIDLGALDGCLGGLSDGLDAFWR